MDRHSMNDTIPFKTIVIVGVGLIGGSLGQAIRRRHPNARIIGVSSPGAVTAAIDIGAVTEGCGYEELSNVAKEADLIFLCTPIHRIQGLLTVLSTSLKAGVTITDVGSTKSEITAHAEEVLSPDVHFIGGHPMAGAEVSGVQGVRSISVPECHVCIDSGFGCSGYAHREIQRFSHRCPGSACRRNRR